MSKKAVLLWVDLEMTGLLPAKDRILEVAAVATGWDLVEIARYEAVVKVSPTLIERRMRGEFWEKNAEVREALIAQNMGGKAAEEVERELVGFVRGHFGKKVILAGNSIHQDRKFIDREWAELAGLLHYRMLDVSAWKVYFEGALGQKFTKKEAHRAIEDIQGSVEEFKWYLSFLGGNNGV
jgi:oligoribonuclease